jgi:hypothetical protein
LKASEGQADSVIPIMGRTMQILGMVLFIFLWWASGAEASCYGSGTTWNCTAGTSAADVSSTLSGAADEATLTFEAGSYSWTTGIDFSMSKGITLICVSVGACKVTGNNVIGMEGSCAGTSTKLYRLSGFVFSGDNAPRVWFYGPTACLLTQVRIDHNTFTGMSNGAAIMFFGENSSHNNYFRGVVDHNTATASVSFYLTILLNGSSSSAPSSASGTINNMFFEDNIISSTTMTDSGSGCIDMWGGHAVVWRYNHCINNRVLAHGVTHAWGPTNFEVYNNTISQNSGSQLQDGYRSIHHQGSGEMMFFNNLITSFSGKSSGAIGVLHYRSFSGGAEGTARCNGTQGIDGNRSPTGTYFGYPCKRQPGRDVNAVLHPIYIWNNRWSDTGQKIDLQCQGSGEIGPSTCVNHVVVDRDYYNAVSATAQMSSTSPFNGTKGMGFGTLANRPTTCTTNAAEHGGGVGYFATDQGAQGTLYRCSNTNTWAVHYAPFAYPHPLQAGGGGGGTTAPLAPPRNLKAH